MAPAPTDGLQSQKKTLYAAERNRPDVIEARRWFRRRMRGWCAANLVFIDESGVNLSQTRAEARAPIGQRIVDHVPGSRWETYSVIAALRAGGIIAPMVVAGAINGDALRAWVEEVLGPELRPGDIVVWDNLSIHTSAEVARLVRSRGARLQFLPKYSPDLNPIELAWSKAKRLLRRIKARTAETLVQALGEALAAITPSDSCAWFRHAGYVAP